MDLRHPLSLPAQSPTRPQAAGVVGAVAGLQKPRYDSVRSGNSPSRSYTD